MIFIAGLPTISSRKILEDHIENCLGSGLKPLGMAVRQAV
jgi:hypothetical protein